MSVFIPTIRYLFSRAAVTNYQKRCGLTQQKFILSQFSRPEIQNQGADRVDSF